MLILGLARDKGEEGGGLRNTFSVLRSIFGIFFYSLCGELCAGGEGCSFAVL